MEENKHELPFELIVGDETGEIMNGDVPVRWCVTPELVKELEDNNIVDPHILLVSATNKGQEMQRQLVPMTELMTYVRFTKAGDQNLFGFIVDGAKGRKKLHNLYLRKISGSFYTDVIYYYTNLPFDDLPHVYTQTEVTVHIPTGVFGKEPSPWMKWFVNFWHTSNNKIVDECHFRRRAMIAFSMKWLPVLIWTIMLVTFRLIVVGASALSGYYQGINFSRIFRPYKWNNIEFHLLADVVAFNENPWLLKRPKHDGEKSTLFFTLPFIPSILLLQAFILGIISLTLPTLHSFGTMMLMTTGTFFAGLAFFDLIRLGVELLDRTGISSKFDNILIKTLQAIVNHFDKNNRWKYLKWIGGGILAAMLILFTMKHLTAGLIFTGFVITFVSLLAYSETILTWIENLYTVAPKNNDYTEIRELLCPKDEMNLVPDIHLIPSDKRTVRLWYLDIKNKVCKPMQQ